MNVVKIYLCVQGSELYGEWWLGLFTRRPSPSLSHVAHVGPKHRKSRVGEAEPRLGWVIFGCLRGGSKVGGGFQREEIFVSIGVSGRGESVLAMVEHGMGVVGSEAAGLGP